MRHLRMLWRSAALKSELMPDSFHHPLDRLAYFKVVCPSPYLASHSSRDNTSGS
jgi:hypothetical protein